MRARVPWAGWVLVVIALVLASGLALRTGGYDLDGDGTPDSVQLGRFDLHVMVTRQPTPAGRPSGDQPAPAAATRAERPTAPADRTRGYNMPADYVHELAGKAFSWDRDWRVLEANPETRVTVAGRRGDERRVHVRVEERRGWAWVEVTPAEASGESSADLSREAFECLESVLFYGMPKARTVQGFHTAMR